MDERPDRRVGALVAERESRSAAQDDVQLLRPVFLTVRLDHVVAFACTDPDVEAERLEAKAPAKRPQDLRTRRRRQPVQVVDREDLVACVAHRARNSRSTTGSI